MDYLVYCIIVVSLCLNAFQAFKLHKKQHILNVDAKELLKEILSGDALIKIQVLDPSGIFYRSPKG